MFSLSQVPFKTMKAHPVRTLILIILTAAQVMAIFTGLMLVRSARQELQLAEARLGADVLVYPTQAMSKISKDGLLMQGTPVQVWKPCSMLSRLEECDNIDAVSHQVYISDGTTKGEPLRITGYEPDTDFVIAPWIAEGPSFIPPQGTLITGSKVRTDEGNTVSIFGKQWPVSGHLLETGSALDEMIFVSMETLKTLIEASVDAEIQTYAKLSPENSWSAALIRINDKENVESVTNWINIYVRKVTAIRSEASLSATAADLQNQIKVIAVIALSAWLLMVLALGIVQSMLMRERRKEIFIWHIIGASRSKIHGVILREAFWTHMAGGIAGILLSLLTLPLPNKILQYSTDLSMSALLSAAGLSLILSLITGCLSSWLAVHSSTQAMNGQKPVNL